MEQLRHAFLVMVHNEPYILETLVKQLDQIGGDIYVHIDKKVRGKLYSELAEAKGNACLSEKRFDVRWGDYSIVECEMSLFEQAFAGHYDYYHLLSGVDLCLKSPQCFHSFFNAHRGKEFFTLGIGPEHEKLISHSTQYYHFFTSFGRGRLRKLVGMLRIEGGFKRLQKIVGINRLRNEKWKLYRGDNWISITHEAVGCILANKDFIRRRFMYTASPDEIYKQTVLMNNGFADKRFVPKDNGISASLRFIDWNRGKPYTWTGKELDELLSTGNLFARKFSTAKDKSIIDYFRNK